MFPITRANNLRDNGTNCNFLTGFVPKLWPIKFKFASSICTLTKFLLFLPFLGIFEPRLYLTGLSKFWMIVPICNMFYGRIWCNMAGVTYCLSSALGQTLQMDYFGMRWARGLMFLWYLRMTNYKGTIYVWYDYHNHSTTLPPYFKHPNIQTLPIFV